jgi:hypothetical protein
MSVMDPADGFTQRHIHDHLPESSPPVRTDDSEEQAWGVRNKDREIRLEVGRALRRAPRAGSRSVRFPNITAGRFTSDHRCDANTSSINTISWRRCPASTVSDPAVAKGDVMSAPRVVDRSLGERFDLDLQDADDRVFSAISGISRRKSAPRGESTRLTVPPYISAMRRAMNNPNP